MALRLLDFSAMRETLRIRNFAVFTLGNVISVTGSWMQQLAVGWLTWRLTESGAWLGAVSMAELAPVIVLAPIMGVVNDRFDRRRIAIIGQYLAALQSLTLAVLTLTGAITPVLILALQMVSGVIQPLIQTSRLVIVPNMVPRERVGNAVAITSLTFNVARILGPMFAAVLITAIGEGWAFAVNAVSYTAVIYALSILKLPRQERPHRAGLFTGMYGEATAGWRYVARHPLLGWIVPMMTVASALTWPVNNLLPGFVDHVFSRGPTALATLVSAYGAGAILGGLFLARRPSAEGLPRIIVRAMMMNGLMIAAFAMTPRFWLAVPFLLCGGMFNIIAAVGSQSLAQIAVSDNMRGRALGTWYTVTRAGPALGGLTLGTLSTSFGFGKPLMCAGCITALTAAVTWYRKRAALRYQPWAVAEDVSPPASPPDARK